VAEPIDARSAPAVIAAAMTRGSQVFANEVADAGIARSGSIRFPCFALSISLSRGAL
jgi:hypothetical protein